MNLLKRGASRLGSLLSVAGMYCLRWAHGDPFADEYPPIEEEEPDDGSTFPVELSPEAQAMLVQPEPSDAPEVKKTPLKGSLAERRARHSARG